MCGGRRWRIRLRTTETRDTPAVGRRKKFRIEKRTQRTLVKQDCSTLTGLVEESLRYIMLDLERASK